MKVFRSMPQQSSQQTLGAQGMRVPRPAPLGKTNPASGFTLIELLVVIAVIAVLLSIVMPSLREARRVAQHLVCSSNLRQMGIALTAYRFENDDRLPSSSHNPAGYWLYQLTAYTQEALLFRCPSDHEEPFVDWHLSLDQQPDDIDQMRWSSFALNSLLDGDYNKVGNIRHPRYTIYISEAPDQWRGVDHTHPELWNSLTQAKRQIAYERHRGRSNYLFVDGHVETLDIEETLDWPDTNYWWPGHAPRWPPMN